MCGLIFTLNFGKKQVSRNRLVTSLKTILHRGPDHSKINIYNDVGMGHCRLSILDLSSKANQPFESFNQRYIIIYNGEVYNYKEIKKKLVNKGIPFRSVSDTEVILNAFIYWGTKCVKMLNGMFSFIIYDKKERKVFLARDRFGIKPLYYYCDDELVIFASEIKAILSYVGKKLKLNFQSIYQYFVFQNILNNQTFFKEIMQVPSGCWGYLNCSMLNKIEFYKYWEIENSKIIKKPKSSLINTLLDKAIERNLVSDVDISSYLSSGIDSSLICHYANKKLNNLNTISCGFKNIGKHHQYDESYKINIIAKDLGNRNFIHSIKKNDNLKYLRKVIYHIDTPRLGQSYPNYIISKFASKYSKVILSGAGGDEIFGGYVWRYKCIFESNGVDQFIDKYLNQSQRVLKLDQISKIFLKCNNNDIKRIKDEFFSFFDKKTITESPEGYFNEILKFDIKNFLQGYLNIEDKLSMAHSLETRVPFLDNDLSDFGLNLKLTDKLEISNKRIYQGKYILRELIKKKLKMKNSFWEKRGFAGPDSYWYKSQFKFKKNILNFLKRPNYLESIIDIDRYFKIISDSKFNDILYKSLIWNLISFDMFLDINYKFIKT